MIIGPKLLTEEYTSLITENLSTQLIDKIEWIIKRMCYKATLFQNNANNTSNRMVQGMYIKYVGGEGGVGGGGFYKFFKRIS